ncbi:MAG TPA: LytTR family DNA-binding domain-containing protein [Blastocatellia bacterium]|nr:LytTR family DNA-binding domain-containing protein [Blastocatellia bacterium]
MVPTPRIFRAIIVDDERLARRELRSLLSEHGEIEVAGEAGNVAQAVRLIGEQEPDVVFLDIQMPGESGFGLFDQVGKTFDVIFVTAFDAYAIRAFEVNALDYLLKPINPERLARAVARLSAGDHIGTSTARRLEYEDRLFLELDGHSRFLKINTIVCLCAAGDYSEIFTADGGKSLVLKSLKEWEERLPEKQFARIHRSTIINLEYIERVEGWFNRSYQIYLRQIEEPFMMSRRYAAKLRLRFG